MQIVFAVCNWHISLPETIGFYVTFGANLGFFNGPRSLVQS